MIWIDQGGALLHNPIAPEPAPANTTANAPGRVLREVFGFGAFRPGQGAVIGAALAGRDVLAVMPTSGGKSLCYQVPALVGEGLTVVVCPLVSLMKDQIDSLKARLGDRASRIRTGPEAVAALHSGLPAAERRRVEAGVLAGEVRILYVAPERMRSLEFALLLRRSGGGAGVSLVVVDEAHCLSEWGHSFRPEYLFLRTAIEDLGRPPVMALTATADPRVRGDIADLLDLRDPAVVRTGFDRPNLRYRVRRVTEGAGRLDAVVEALEEGERPAIVYAPSRRRAEEIASGLALRGVRAHAYHAGMSAAERDAVQGRFMADELPVIVATVAFGMGVDKPNVRTVVHAGVPNSIPAYVQEAGRAGRDGGLSHSTVLFSPEELSHRMGLAGLGLTTADEARSFFDELCEISVRETSGPCRGLLRANPKPADLASLGGVGHEAAADALRSLEATGRVRRRYNLWAEVRVRRMPRPEYAPSGGPAGAVLAVLGRLGGAVSAIPLPDLAREAGVSPATAQVSLSRLMAAGLLDAAPRGVIADVLIKPGHLSRRELAELRRRFELRAAVEARQLEDVGRYASLTTCRRARLLSHFGDETAEFVAPCDGCDVCRGTSVRKPAGPRGGHPGERPGGRPGERPFLLGRVLGGLCEAFGLGARVAPAAPRPNDEPPA